MATPAVQARTESKKKEFLEAFSRSRGSISDVCDKVHISRDTFYEWRKTDPAFAQALVDVRSTLDEEVEDLLMEKIFIDKDATCIRYYLDRRHPAYNPRMKVTHNTTSTVTLEDILRNDATAHLEGLTAEAQNL